MSKETLCRGPLLCGLFALILGAVPAAVVSECDAACEQGTDALTGEETEVCGKADVGESGADACYTALVPEEQDDGTVEFVPRCQLIWGPCKESSGVWNYPIA